MLLNPNDTLERQNEKLLKIAEALMRRVEDKTSESGLAYAQFERAALLEQQVRRRTEDLERALDLLHDSNGQLSAAKHDAELARLDLADAIETVDGGFGLFGPDNRLVMANSRFCADLKDVRQMIRPGLSFNNYVEAISRSPYLSLPENVTSEDWRQHRLQSHGDDQVVFNVRLSGNRWVQVSEHRTATGGTVILQTDVSALMRLQREEREKLRDTQARNLQATLDHLEQGVCIFDQEGMLAGWNKRMEQLIPLPRIGSRDLMNLPFSRLLHQFSDEFTVSGELELSDVLDWANAVGPRQPLRFEIERIGGQILGVFAQEMPDRGFVISFTDMTAERKAASDLANLNEELEQRVRDRTVDLDAALEAAKRANASKTRFVAAASHDLLQPLSAAKLFIQSVPDATPDPAVHDVIEKAVGALSGAEEIIGALLDISRLDVEEVPFSIKTVPLAGLLSSIQRELAPHAQAKGLDLRCVPSSLAVVSDPTYLRRIVQNLAANAVRYTQTGRVLIGVRRLPDAVRIEVHDSGPGIAEEDQETIFQEFKRLNPEGNPSGLGLGLAIVKRACSRLGHTLKINSEIGRGCCFSVTLPIAESNAPRVADPAKEPREQVHLGGLIVLIVENSEAMNRALATMVEGWGGQAVTAASGEEALALLDEIELAPDALLLDFQLDGALQGTDVFREIVKRYGDIPARIVSAARHDILRDACDELALTVISKPVDSNALRDFLLEVATPKHTPV